MNLIADPPSRNGKLTERDRLRLAAATSANRHRLGMETDRFEYLYLVAALASPEPTSDEPEQGEAA